MRLSKEAVPFPTKGLRSTAADNPHVCRPRSVCFDAYVAGENRFHFISPLQRAKLDEFFDKLNVRQSAMLQELFAEDNELGIYWNALSNGSHKAT